METKESLTSYSWNYGHISKHGKITDSEVDKVNLTISIIESGRTEETPIMGDRIVCSNPENTKKYPFAHLDTPLDLKGTYSDHRAGHICVQAYTPFVLHDGKELKGFSTSGGYWILQREREMYEFIRKVNKCFCIWGSNGPRASGAVYFRATVNEWKLIDEGVY